ncbi:fasciclin domain-containing protein [Winogradskyella wichelsiae]|uniref:fasciclin domain-containing protein n=1 Tax=Winogradskyella wichelsiae TaxID=2697007 RepID=UPI003EF6F8DB
MLKYHVTASNYSKEFKKPDLANNGYVKVEVVNGEPLIGGAKILTNYKARSGIAHLIDKVLLPLTG